MHYLLCARRLCAHLWKLECLEVLRTDMCVSSGAMCVLVFEICWAEACGRIREPLQTDVRLEKRHAAVFLEASHTQTHNSSNTHSPLILQQQRCSVCLDIESLILINNWIIDSKNDPCSSLEESK